MENRSIEEILSQVTSNEGLMEKIGSIVKNNKSGEITDTLPDVLDAISPLFNKSDESRRGEGGEEALKEQDKKQIFTSSSSVLLNALKPYLSKERAEMVDTIIKIGQIAQLLRIGW